MLLFVGVFIVGLVILMWSADKFVEGSASIASRLGMPRLLVGIVIVGFGTSAPEMTVSALAAIDGNPGIALGNAYGSNIANIALILGIAVLIRPIGIERTVMVREVPILLGVTLFSLFLLSDGFLSFMDAILLLAIFAAIMFFTITSSMREAKNKPNPNAEEEKDEAMSVKHSTFWIITGLLLLVASSRMLVWSAVSIATAFGVSDVIIGLTVVAIGTSLPELASAIAATKRNEHSLVIGNILGSNFFNTLAVVGLAGTISPMGVSPEFLYRDIFMVIVLTTLVFLFGIRAGSQKEGTITRFEGVFFLAIYAFYTVYLISIVMNNPLFEWPTFGF